MKVIKNNILIILLLILALLFNNKANAYSYKNRDIKIIGHRGASEYEPENTIPAFEKAAKLKMWGVECDIHTLKDGNIIVFHDDDVERMTNGSGKISNMNLLEIKSLNIDNGNNINKYKELKIPTLDEYLRCCKRNNLIPVIEFKNININSVKCIIDKIKQEGLENNTIIISSNYKWVKYIRKYTYKIQFQYLADINLENINLIKQYGNYGIDVRCDKVTKELVKLAHENGAKVNVWNVNTNEEVDKLLRFGVDMVTSNKNFN